MKTLKITDPQIYRAILKETKRQNDKLQMIASENYVDSAILEAEARLRDAPNARRREIQRALRDASPEWSGKIRSCPKCQTSFKSNSNMGQCTNCSFIFFASHPELGDARDWMIRLRRNPPSGEQAN